MRAPAVRRCGTVLALGALAWATASASAQTPKQRAFPKGLSYAVDTLAISPDGTLLAAGGQYGADGELKLWDLTTGLQPGQQDDRFGGASTTRSSVCGTRKRARSEPSSRATPPRCASSPFRGGNGVMQKKLATLEKAGNAGKSWQRWKKNG